MPLWCSSDQTTQLAGTTGVSAGLTHPFSWAASTRLACSVPRGHCRALSAPKPTWEERLRKHTLCRQRHSRALSLDHCCGSVRSPQCKTRGMMSRTCVVAVMDRTKVGTVEQLRLSRRPWGGKRKPWVRMLSHLTCQRQQVTQMQGDPFCPGLSRWRKSPFQARCVLLFASPESEKLKPQL